MTTRDETRRGTDLAPIGARSGPRGEPRRRPDRPVRLGEPSLSLPGAALRRPRARRASTSTGPSATRRSGPATWRRWSAATTASCRAPSTRRASCATTRSTSASTPRRSSASGGASAAMPRRPRPSSPSREPIAQPRPGLHVLARHRRRGAPDDRRPRVGVYLGVQVLRFAKPPTLAVTDPTTATLTVDEDTTSYARGHHDPRRDVTIEVAGGTRDDGRLDRRRGAPTSTSGAARTSSASTRPTPTPASTPSSRSSRHHRAVPRDRGADADRRPARRRARRSRTARSPSRARPRTRPTYRSPRPTTARRGRRRRRAPARAASAGAGRRVTRRRSPDDGTLHRDAAPAHDGQLVDHRHGVQRGGQDASLTRHVRSPTRASTSSSRSRAARPGSRSGSTASSIRHVGRPARTHKTGKTLTFTGQEVDRGPDRLVGRDAFTLNGTCSGALGKRGIPETWLFQPPATPREDDSAT